MPELQERAITDPDASELLDAYFAQRVATFDGVYRINRVEPSAFAPPSGVFLVLVDDGRALGCGGVRALTPARFEIKHVFVRPESRGSGYGRMLLRELERRALAFGAAEVVLDTNASLTAAAGLYRSNGYDEIPAYNDNPNATHWFAKPLA